MSRILRALLDELHRQYEAEDVRFVFLGDLIDRGQTSFRVMNDLCDFFELRPSSVLILGNHDEYLRNGLRGEMSPGDLDKWMWNGGDTTLRSYAIYEGTMSETRDLINRAYPRHLKLLDSAVPMFLTERHCFVHAGIDPSTPLDQQEERTLRWVREGFLEHTATFEKIVVHGHTITETEWPEVYPNRIAIDTGSYRTGRISAAIFDNDHLAGFVCAQQTETGITTLSLDAALREKEPVPTA